MLTHDAVHVPAPVASIKFSCARARGRPAGQELVAQARGLRLHHLAIMRAVVHGMTPADAAKRYLPELQDLRVVRSELQIMTREACVHLDGLGEVGLAKALASVFHSDSEPETVSDESGPGAGAGAGAVPSLEEFATQFDVDMYSERELQQLYEEEFGVDAAPPAVIVPRQEDLLERALRGLNLVQSHGVQIPRGDDSVSLWLSPRLCAQLAPLGVLQLRDVVTLANRAGRTWWRTVPGLGRDRAQRLMQWLLDHKDCLGVSFSARIKGVTRVEPDSMPAELQRNLPSLRADGVNALGADTDAQAVGAWLETLSLKSTHTQSAYRRDVERLLWWARERGKGLTTLVVTDAVEHARFLLDPPAHWINPLPSTRECPDWRPMRGPLSASSANRALAAIGHLYGFLVESGYLVANPFARVHTVSGTKTLQVRVDTTRSFSADHLALIETTLSAMPEDVTKRRLIAILALAETTGLRISELAGHTWADLHKLPGDHGELHGLRVLGKGAREREVPIRPGVMEALAQHRADRVSLAVAGVVDGALSEGQIPLLSIIEKAPARKNHSGAGHLSRAGIHQALRRFFQAVAQRADDERLRADFERASCHWLRHTFAREVLRATGNDLAVTQQLLDHRSISTTGIYVKADMTQRIEAVLAMPERFNG